MTSAHTDVLTAVVDELRFDHVGYRRLEFDGPFSIPFSHQGLRGVHAVTTGTCDLSVRSAPVVHLRTGDVVILPRGDTHSLAGAGPCAILCGAFVVPGDGHPVLAALPHVVVAPSAGPMSVGPLITAIASEVNAPAAGGDVVLSRLSDALVVQAFRYHMQTSPAGGLLAALRDPDIARALSAIHSDPGRGWDLTSLSRVARLSRTAFSARFTELMGQPAMRYVTGIRMQRAIAMLRDEHRTVAAVSGHLGYASESAFAAAFKRVTGETPGRVRAAAAG